MTHTSAPDRRSWLARVPLRGTDATLGLVIIAAFIVLSATSGGTILTKPAILSILTYLTVPVLIGLAQMTVLAIGQLNLAVGAMGGATCALMAVLMASLDLPVWLALPLGLAASTAMGALNGILVIATKLNGFIITLGTMTILLGVQYLLVHSFTIDAYSTSLQTFGQRNIGGIPYIFVFAVLIAIAVAWFYARTLPGRRMLATGGNELAARLSGISNPRSVFHAHTFSGLLIGFASLATIASAPGINRSIGGDWLLPSFAAPIIGGVLLTGGGVAILGTVLAAGLLRLVDVARAEYLLDPSWVNFVIGAVVLSTVVLTEWRKRRAHRRNRPRPGSDGAAAVAVGAGS